MMCVFVSFFGGGGIHCHYYYSRSYGTISLAVEKLVVKIQMRLNLHLDTDPSMFHKPGTMLSNRLKQGSVLDVPAQIPQSPVH